MFVCTLPSPACMCSATNTRPRRTCACTASIAAIIGSKSRPEKPLSSGSRSSRFPDILVDLERVGVLRDRRRARAVEPEALALLPRGRDESLAVTGIGDPHDVRGRLADGGLVVAHDVADEHHARAPAALRLGRVAHG